MDSAHRQQQEWRRRRPSWCCTLLTQACLCIALYAALHAGRPRVPRYVEGTAAYVNGSRKQKDVYFISVGGGTRSLDRQEQLLQQMEDVARTYGTDFIVNLSELGESDPLMQNVSVQFPFLKGPWYVTSTSVGGSGYFKKQIKVALGLTLDIISLDTGLLQGYFWKGQSDNQTQQLNWLVRSLATTQSNWRLVIGFHSLAACGELHTVEKVNFYKHLHSIFLKYKVNAYLSNHGCGSPYTNEDGIKHIQNHGFESQKCRSHAMDVSSQLNRDICDGFHLHRVGRLEIESYFINPAGEVVSRSTVQQWGRAYM